ncbi:hypothetical protein ACQ4PT_017444 [Festuca glaucescens]
MVASASVTCAYSIRHCLHAKPGGSSNSQTLCAQLLKAKYYPNGSFIGTVFAGNGSSTWHAIEYGLELLDPWIPRDASHLPRTPQGRCRYRWVSNFLEPDGSWNIQRLQQYFVQEDIDEILKIQTSRRNDNDFIAWHPEKRGVFTVKSAYRLALNASMQRQDIRSYECQA